MAVPFPLKMEFFSRVNVAPASPQTPVAFNTTVLFTRPTAESSVARNEGVESRDPLFRTRPCSIIRQGKWKLHQYFEDGGLELYDLEKDVGETADLAERMPEKTKALLGRLEQWRAAVNAPVPTAPNPLYSIEAEAAAITATQEKAALGGRD